MDAVVIQEPAQAGEEGNSDDFWEEERSWRDPSAHKLRVALARWLDPEYRTKELIKVCCLELISDSVLLLMYMERNHAQETALTLYPTNTNSLSLSESITVLQKSITATSSPTFSP